MPMIETAGLYKGEIKDFAVTKTRVAGLPQLVVNLSATECYNGATEEWEDCRVYQVTTTGYLVLVSFDKKTGQLMKCFAYDNVMEAVGWNGETYSGLAAMNLKGKRVQFRVIENVYEGKTNFKVDLIASEDAEIGLRKLSDKDLTKIDAEFRIVAAKKATPATPKSTKKAVAPAPAAPKPPAIPKKTAPKQTVKQCTAEEAYQACFDANEALGKTGKSVPGEILDDYWVSRTTSIAADTDNVTDEESAQIRDAVLNDLTIPF